MTREDSLKLAIDASGGRLNEDDLFKLANKFYDYSNQDTRKQLNNDFQKLNDVDNNALFEMNIHSTNKTPQSIESFFPNYEDALGRDLVILNTHRVYHNNPGYKIEFPGETVRLVFEISKDEIGYILMTKKAWETFKNK